MSYDWKNILIKPQDSIRNALKTIDSEALRIALVVNEQMRLLGVVTDGDIRRGLLRNLTLDTKVTDVMNPNPLTISSSTSRKEAEALMQSKRILAVPVVNDDVLIGLETLQHIGVYKKYDNPIFIMAGGFGTRLRPLTDNTPKPMLKIGDKPLLEILVCQLIKFGFSNFFISTHYLADVVQEYFGDGSKYGVSIKYIHEKTPLGTGGALGLLPDTIPRLPLILINGDILTTIDFENVLAFHEKQNAIATMCVRQYDYQVPYGVIKGDGTKIISMEEKPVQQFFVNAGIYVINPEVIENIESDKYIDMPNVLQKYIEVGGSVTMYPIHEYWLDIGRIEDYERAQRDIKGLGI